MTVPSDPHKVYDEVLTCEVCKEKFRCVRRSKPKAGEKIRFCPNCRRKRSGFYSKTPFLKRKP